MGVHVWGQPCYVEMVAEIAEKHDLKLMFDASHAFGCSHGGKLWFLSEGDRICPLV